ncbi:hypothetical protein CRYUN_Cryun14cG0035400 [Craigia yunnanensis]
MRGGNLPVDYLKNPSKKARERERKKQRMGDLYALDFDGVLCNSCGESSLFAVKVAEGLTVEGILENWSKIKSVIMEEWDENRDALIDLFGKDRDEWMDKDLATWIGANRLYPGVPDALRFASSTIDIVTTKQVQPNVKVLEQLQLRLEHQGMKLHFVEDRLATLKNAIKEPELDGWNLYPGDWGYNTQKEKEEAASIPRIRLLQLSNFSKKLK